MRPYTHRLYMLPLQSAIIQCPYCGEDLDILVDTSIDEQDYIEDCQVCCRPIEIYASADNGEIIELWARSDSE